MQVIVADGIINPTIHLCARVFLDIEKPSVQVVPITLKGRKFLVQHEKLLIFCYFWGLIDHNVTECGDGLLKKEECEWGDCLLVNFVHQLVVQVTGERDEQGEEYKAMDGLGRMMMLTIWVAMKKRMVMHTQNSMIIQTRGLGMVVRKMLENFSIGCGKSNITRDRERVWQEVVVHYKSYDWIPPYGRVTEHN